MFSQAIKEEEAVKRAIRQGVGDFRFINILQLFSFRNSSINIFFKLLNVIIFFSILFLPTTFNYTADIWRRYHWFSRQMTSEKRAQKIHTDDASLPSASDWLNQISHAARPIRSTTQIWVVTRHHYGLSALVSQTIFGGKTHWWRREMWAVLGSLFCQANLSLDELFHLKAVKKYLFQTQQ